MMANTPKTLELDDNPGMHLILGGIIEDEGYDVVEAADRSERPCTSTAIRCWPNR